MSSNKISTITSSVSKFISEQAGTLDHFKKEREAKTKHHQKDRIKMHDLSARQSRLTPIKTGMTHREEVEMDEASKGNPARPKSKMDIIRTASKDAANRPPGATPSWLKKAVKIDTKKDIGYKVVDVGPGQKETVRSQHNWKEEVDLDEAKRGRPPKQGSKAWHASQSKSQSGEGEEQEADKNIVNQMRKKPVGDHHHLTFNNGEKKQVHVQHVNKALSMLANTHKPADREKLQNSLSHSHDRFMSTVKSGKPVEDAPKPKVSLGKMKAEAIEVQTSPIDVGAITPSTFRDKFGVLRMRNVQKGRKAFKGDIIKDETEINVVELEYSLNSLYENLSEENKEIFKQMIVDVDGFNQLVDFAKEQGL